MKNFLVLAGRFLFGGFFVYSGVMHFLHLHDLVEYSGSKGVPMPELAVGAAGTMLTLGGLSYLLGWHTKWGGVVLLAFLLPAAFLIHSFWKETDPVTLQIQMSYFLRNLAFSGAILMSFREARWALGLHSDYVE